MAGDRGRGWAFIDLAGLGVNTVRSYVVTLLRILVLPVGFVVLAFAALYAAAASRLLPPSGEPAAVIATGFATVVVLGLVLAWSVARAHRRPWMSLVSTDLALDPRRLAIGVGVEGALLLIIVSVAHLVIGNRAAAPGGAALTLPAAAVAIALTPLQAASEEMLFRGYLTQGLGRLVRSRVAIAVIVGILFGAAHFNAYGPLTMPYLFILSLIYSLVSLRDERLELTIGAHTATNWFAMAAGYAAGINPTAAHVRWSMIAVLLLNGALFYALTRLFVRLFCERRTAGAPAAR